MATYETPFHQPINLNLVTCYKPTGRYFAGQRILHDDFGLGTVTQVRRQTIHVVMDQDPDQPGGKKARCFSSASLTLQEAMTANKFDYEDMNTLFEWNEEDLEESLALFVHDLAKAILMMSSMR